MAECEACRGNGIIYMKCKDPSLSWVANCEACGGSGIQNCCEGLQACPVVDGDYPDNPAEADSFGRKK
jgi:DnaJ-class molecular chaperone